ncbi:hypothetical protein [Methylobacterium platani]|uniref:hypothetical protein n=1 Tax=Methylobacterium platani TaxID=427683 RepID=UPI0006537E1F|nr:hypothetical protein [Methylobacterium platani]
MRTAARAYRFVDGRPRRADRSCATRSGAAQDAAQGRDRGHGRPAPEAAEPVREIRPVGEIWSAQASRGLSARELIRLAQAVRLRPRHG